MDKRGIEVSIGKLQGREDNVLILPQGVKGFVFRCPDEEAGEYMKGLLKDAPFPYRVDNGNGSYCGGGASIHIPA